MPAREGSDGDRSGGAERAAALGEPGEPRGVQPDIADADKQARSGKPQEALRNTPPAGRWNDTSAD